MDGAIPQTARRTTAGTNIIPTEETPKEQKAAFATS